MIGFTKKVLGIVVMLCVMVAAVAGLGMTASAADGVSVTIESFIRGEQTDLRSSELLVAKVEGYDGNVLDLTYEWKSTLGTYLYVYNSHNMYSINNTDGEIEIYNSDKNIPTSENMKGRSYNRSFSGKGYAYASVYGANLNAATSLDGTITVTVKDASGNVLATDTHTGKITESGSFWKKYTYSGIVPADLQTDLDNVSFGLFEGDTRNVKDLLGESAILHITCDECDVTKGKIESGKNFIELTKNGDYYITGKVAGTATTGGDAQVSVTVKKGNCKFHKNTEGTATTTVYVYKKPIPVPTTTSITLAKESLDSRCRYFIDGVEATTQADGTVIFTGLTPNTDYEIEVVGDTHDTAPAYAYVYTRTLPVFNAKLEVYLNGTYDSETATVTSGTLVDLTTLGSSDNDLYIKKIDTNVFVELVHTGTGTYSIGVENGVYEMFYEADVNTLLPEQQLTIDGESRTRYMFFNSVEYDANGGEGAPEIDYYYSGNPATVSDVLPTREGFLFKGWQDQDGKVYQANDLITNSIFTPYKLTAIWEDAIDVYVYIRINHVAADGVSQNSDRAKHNIAFTVDGRMGTEGNFTELYAKEILWDGVSDFTYEGFGALIAKTTDETIYRATQPTFKNMPSGMQYTFTTSKSGYELIKVETETAENGDVNIYATLQFDPNNFDFVFNAKLDEASKLLPDVFKPAAVNVKVTSWYNNPHDENDLVGWYHITQHHDTYVRMALDENDEATATFPVWIQTTDAIHNYSYRINVVSYELADGTIIEAKDVGNKHETFITDDERYLANIEVVGGQDPDGDGVNTLTGAYYDGTKQVGTVTAIIAIDVYDVTFDPNGGMFADGTTESKKAEKQIAIPAFADYLPTRDGGYTFLGWYVADENGNMTETLGVEGEIIFNDVTLIAKWADPVTVEGTVSVAGTYMFEGNEREIYDIDRATAVDVLLQKIDANGYAHTIKTYHTAITYEDNIGKGSYKFENLPNDGTTYRIKVINANYGELYQNETTSSQVVTDYDAYDAIHYTAVFGEDSVATVNAYLPFEPKEFPLQYEVDATAIGEGYRPIKIDLLILCDDNTGIVNPQEWAVISQLVSDGQTHDLLLEMTGGFGEDAFNVWTSKTDGTDLYDYTIKVTGYNGGTIDHVTAPYIIHYNGPARYSATSGQTHVLKATIVPRMYIISFDLNAGEDVVTGMDDYLTVRGVYEDFYYWSYGKAVTAVPSRENYEFLGWFDEDGNKVTEITPDMARDITLTAQWKKITYKVETVADPAEGGVTAGDGTYDVGADATVTATANENYKFIGWYENGEKVSDNAEYTFKVTTNHTLTAKFEKVTYTVETVADPEEGGVTTGNGTYDAGADATVTATANENYKFVGWYENGEKVSDDAKYTFTVTTNHTLTAKFEKITYKVETVADPAEGGVTTGNGTYDAGAQATVTATANENYKFVGWYEDGEKVSDNAEYTFAVTTNHTLTAKFEKVTYTVATVADPEEGGVTTGNGTYDAGAKATVTATANENYKFVGWYENGENVSNDAEYTFAVTGNRTLTAKFEKNAPVVVTYTVTTEVVGNGSTTGDGTYEKGTEVTLTAEADEGNVFVGWKTVDGELVTLDKQFNHVVNADVTFVAYFEKSTAYKNDYAYIFGYNDTQMGAEGSLLRCEASAMVHRLVKQNGKLGDFKYDSSNPSFTDIEGEWFQSGIEFMHHKGGFTAEEGTDVQPYVAITRGEAFKLISLGLGFTSDTTLSNAEYANLLFELGYIQGDTNGNLDVDGMITRAQFCTMYNRIIGREGAVLVDAEGKAITAETYGFTDLDSNKWYYDEMLRATSAYENGFVDLAKRGIRNNLDDYGN